MILINGDCIHELKKLGSKCADMALTSPPYNMNLRIRNGKHCSRQIVKEISTKYKNYDDNLSMQDYYNFNASVINQLLRVCKGPIFYNIQFLTGNKQALYKLIGEFSSQLKEFIVWDKINAQPAIGEGILNSQFEVLLVFDSSNAISRKFNDPQFLRGTLSNHWSIKRGKKPSNTHGAVFPIELAERVINNFSSKSQVVIDPFMGCGTTGAACKALGRDFIGIEIDKDYYDLAVSRIDSHQKQGVLTV